MKFEDLVTQIARERGLPRPAASRIAAEQRPDLHAEYERGLSRSGLGAGMSPPRGSLASSAKARWNEAIQLRVDRGLSKAAALRDVIASDPALHREYLAEANSEPSGAAPEVHPDVRAWQSALSGLIDGGMERGVALRHLVKTEPAMHERYIAASNLGREVVRRAFR